MRLDVQNYLKHWSEKESVDLALERIAGRPFHIKTNIYEDRVMLNYDQRKSPKLEKIAMECRGLCLRLGTWEILTQTFDRFFNYGEIFETLDFKFEESITFEKIDGSLGSIYFDDINWEVSTRGTAYAESSTMTGRTFRSLYEEAFDMEIRDLANVLSEWKDWSFITEVVSRDNRVVKDYGKAPKVYLLRARNKISGQYITPESVVHLFKDKNIPIFLPTSYDLSELKTIEQSLKNLPTLDEGYVCYHPSTGRSVKIKNPSYVAVHHLRDNGVLNANRIVALISENETDEYLSYFPDDTKYFIPYQNAYNRLIEDIYTVWNEEVELEGATVKVKNIRRQKDFALHIKDKQISSILFRMRKYTEEGKVENVDWSVQEIIDSLQEKQKTCLIEKYLDPNEVR